MIYVALILAGLFFFTALRDFSQGDLDIGCLELGGFFGLVFLIVFFPWVFHH